MTLEVLRQRHPDENSRAYSYWALRRNIMILRLEPGAILNEAELGEQLGMSRTPIREALILLGNEGLVDILPQRGRSRRILICRRKRFLARPGKLTMFFLNWMMRCTVCFTNLATGRGYGTAYMGCALIMIGFGIWIPELMWRIR